MSENHLMRVIAYKEGDYWIAQALERDIAAQAKNLDELWHIFEITYQVELQASLDRGDQPFAGIDPAPATFQEMWGRRSGEYRPVRRSGRDDVGAPYEMALCA